MKTLFLICAVLGCALALPVDKETLPGKSIETSEVENTMSKDESETLPILNRQRRFLGFRPQPVFVPVPYPVPAASGYGSHGGQYGGGQYGGGQYGGQGQFVGENFGHFGGPFIGSDIGLFGGGLGLGFGGGLGLGFGGGLGLFR